MNSVVWNANRDCIDRRQHVRVYDAVALQTEVVPRSAYAEAVEKFAQTREAFLASGSITAIAQKPVCISEEVRKAQPELSKVVTQINDKLNRLIECVETDRDELSSSPTHKVNLSESGICFGASEPMPQSQYIYIRMKLFPLNQRVIAIAETVTCREVDGLSLSGTFFTGARFVLLDHADCNLLSCHVERLHQQSNCGGDQSQLAYS
ncbi:MAG: hypothetical protein AAF434_20020 [Pseudomonadota bacterium]